MSDAPLLIETPDALVALCQQMAHDQFITVDTEFVREKTYWPQLCLVQVAGEKVAACIDPLATGMDLAPLYELFANPGIIKVFHASRQDLEIFQHLTGNLPYPLFDTQIAAMVCGFGDAVSYQNLVAALARTNLDKTMRFTDWAARPLSRKQLQYALADVTHLRTVYEKLRAKLESTGRLNWVDQEMAELSNPASYIVEPEDAWRRIKAQSHNPRFLACMRELASWREREAQNQDRPRKHILRDETILEVAALAPSSRDELARARSLSKGYADSRHGASILEAIARARALSEEQCPHLPYPCHKPRGIGPLVEMLKVLLAAAAEDHGVATRLIATVDDLEQLAMEEDADIPALKGWRREIFGNDALKLKDGQVGLANRRGQIKLFPIKA